MAEYWKSQPKKYCDFCKCWISDNKASIEFHERGRNHQENVKLRISEVKKKGTERREQQNQLSYDLAAIEAAALKAYKKDLGYTDDSKTEVDEKECVDENTLPKTFSTNVEWNSTSTWTAYQTNEGHWYYYNNESGESSWEPPPEFQIGFQQNSYNREEYKKDDDTEAEKPALENVEVNSEENKVSETATNPFGAWETVAVYDSVDTSEEAAVVNEQVDEIPEKVFKEKQMPTSKTTNVKPEEVTFKKRKNDKTGKKRSIRQRIDDS